MNELKIKRVEFMKKAENSNPIKKKNEALFIGILKKISNLFYYLWENEKKVKENFTTLFPDFLTKGSLLFFSI